MGRRMRKMAEINFLPVCSNCGRVLYGQEIAIETDIIDNEVEALPLKIPYSRITPWRCCYCGEVFEMVTMPTKLPFSVPRPIPKFQRG